MTAPADPEPPQQTEQPAAPGAPTLVTPEDGAEKSTSVVLKWEALENADSYEVQVAESEKFANLIVEGSSDSTSLKVEELPVDASPHWKVRSVSGDQTGPWSNIRTFTTSAVKAGGGDDGQGDEGQGDDSQEEPAAAPSGDFVTVSNGDFMLNGEVFRFAGTNAYHLPTYMKQDPSVVERALDAFQEAGVNVVRAWGFYDGAPHYNGDITLQPKPGQYNEEDLKRLDQLIAKAGEHDVKFIFALINYWGELGGMPQYNAWDGNAGAGMQHFMNDPDTQKWFKDYIEMLLNRTNTVTGVKYKNDPTILGWEIMNEGRNPQSSNPQELANWYQDIAQYIKSIDKNHLVATGEEGFDYGTPAEYNSEQYTNTYVLRAKEGTSYIANTSIPEIDFGTAHWYPTRWIGTNPADVKQSQKAFMEDHARIAEELGKPFVIGEYGYEGDGGSTQLEIYNHLWDFNEQNQVDGSLLWQFTADYVKCYEYRGNICWPGGRKDAELYKSFTNHIQAMTNQK